MKKTKKIIACRSGICLILNRTIACQSGTCLILNRVSLWWAIILNRVSLRWATFAEIANTTIEHEIDGISFLSHLKGGKAKRQISYCWYARNGGPNGKEFAHTGKWKLYSNGKFYNVYKDVTENNPIKINRLNDKVRSIHSKLQKELDRMKGTRTIFDLSK